MSAPISSVEVCNLSLDLLRHSSLITSLETPETEEESLGARWYDATRRSCLRMFPWNFARKRATLSRLPTAPAFGYADAYQLPNDYLQYVFIGEDPVTDPITDFVVEGNHLLIDNDGASSLQICYIWDIQDVSKFDPIFLMWLVGELAVMFGNSLTGLNKSIKGMELFRDRWEAKARAKNGQENPPKVVYNSPLARRRHQGQSTVSYDGRHLIP
jgi:hypothetical protein